MKKIIHKILVLVCLITFNLSFAESSTMNPVTMEEIKVKVDLMLISPESQYEVIKICGPCNNICAVAINPSYREFPNVIIFNFDDETGEYKRVFEGLCIGIQDSPSDKLDVHTVGMGIDTYLKNAKINFNSETVKEYIEIANNTKMVAIPYRDFIHMHSSTCAEEFYTIDKTKFHDLAAKLIGNVFKKYPRGECTMFDMPDITDLQLSYKNGKYLITGVTDNNQLWKVSFTGIDRNNQFLLKKSLEVKKQRYIPVNEYDALIQKAKEQLKTNPKNALTTLSKAKELNPGNAQAYLVAGMAYYKMGASTTAGSEFRRCLELSSEKEKKKYINEIDVLTTTFKSDKESKLYNDADEALEAGEAEKAVKLLTDALNLNPQNAALFFYLGYTYIELNEIALAISYLEKGRSINPAYQYTLNELKYAYAELGNLEQLKEIINEIKFFHGDNPWLYQELGYTYYLNDMVDLAIETFEINIKNFPEFYGSYYSLGQIYFLKNDYAKTRELLSIFINNATEENFNDPNGSLEDYKNKAQEMLKKCDEHE